jgi:hypothetical protein
MFNDHKMRTIVREILRNSWECHEKVICLRPEP